MANTLDRNKKVMVVSMLCEGASIRAIERITGIHRDTIMRLGVRIGEACEKLMDQKLRQLPCKEIQVDEIWGFVGKKKKATTAEERAKGYGDIWTFISLDADTKLIANYVVGKRDLYHARMFMEDLASRLTNRVQISSDALKAYVDAVERGFGANVDYAQLVKTYAVVNLNQDAAHRYSPAEVVEVEKNVVRGNPDQEKISTSYIEKQNHTLRMHCRRLTRLTNAFSKKPENFRAAIGLNLAYYNFFKVHGTVRMTPAMAAGITNEIWSVDKLVEICGE